MLSTRANGPENHSPNEWRSSGWVLLALISNQASGSRA